MSGDADQERKAEPEAEALPNRFAGSVSLNAMFERKVNYQAAYTSRVPAVDDDLLVATRWALDWVKHHGGRLLVVAPLKSSFDDEPLRSIGGLGVKASSKTIRNARSDWRRGAVLAVWPDKDSLLQLDELVGVEALVVVPWVDAHIDTWRRARQPQDLLGSASTASPPRLDPVVVAALTSITTTVNLSSGLTHPSDKATAVHALNALHTAGYTWNADDVEVWALANGWHARGAKDLHRYAEGIAARRSFKTSRPSSLRAHIVDQWRAAAATD